MVVRVALGQGPVFRFLVGWPRAIFKSHLSLKICGVFTCLALSGCAAWQTSSMIEMKNRQQIAKEFMDRGNLKASETALLAIEKDYPLSFDNSILLGEVYLKQKKPGAARKQFEKARQIQANQVAWTGIGRAELASNRAKSAQKAFDVALKISPGYVPALNGHGVAHDLQGSHKVAQQIYREILKRKPYFRPALINLSLSHALSGNTARGRDLLEDLLTTGKPGAQVRQNLALIYMIERNEIAALKVAKIDISEYQAMQNIEFMRRYVE